MRCKQHLRHVPGGNMAGNQGVGAEAGPRSQEGARQPGRWALRAVKVVGSYGQHPGISEPGRHPISAYMPVSYLPGAPGDTGMCSREKAAPARTDKACPSSQGSSLALEPRGPRGPDSVWASLVSESPVF